MDGSAEFKRPPLLPLAAGGAGGADSLGGQGEGPEGVVDEVEEGQNGQLFDVALLCDQLQVQSSGAAPSLVLKHHLQHIHR